ncbi:hypothetical protein BEWA_023430 [Theileria equi strain WA]|uniref:Uncharacterized protein n=1 Tax=Theileria equi strain WA TaxID=1537102 RepID=L0AX79_THEEQ|nr:hypothetical protein BEWA_023430 [Theileria equi strain WA]AFZ79494.1 hypothetical protein BEWA_023430 [Theileria equi strain WA]|eukprot:XP_004829160.1 hypothetical protein BEWA_023430 [Theileria equi strain WA]
MEIDCSNTFLGDVFGKHFDGDVAIDCFGAKRRNVISRYNRKPEVYKSTAQSLSDLLREGATSIYSSLTQVQREAKGEHVDAVTQDEKDDHSKVNVRQVWNSMLCISGAGLGMLSLSLLGIFGVCAAAGVSCSALVCKKCLQKHEVGQGHDCGIVPLNVSNEYKPSTLANHSRPGFYSATEYIPIYGQTFKY